MKKVVVAFICIIFVIGLLASCNKDICPAYASKTETMLIENNG